MSNVSEAERCPELWFPDGNLVFRAENMLFRVYRGVLANKSTIFADMLAVPQPSADDGETFEGCPVVVLSDSAVDVRRFFGVLHDSDYYDEHCKNDNSAIFSILRLATKYDVALLRKRLLAHFAEAVPQSSSLIQWDAASQKRAILGSSTCVELDIIAVKVARELDVPALLPCALFRCALGPLDLIVHGVTTKDGRHFELDAQDKQACFIARERVRGRVHDHLTAWSYPDDCISKITGTWRAGASPASHSQKAASSVASRPAASRATHVQNRASSAKNGLRQLASPASSSAGRRESDIIRSRIHP